jgi:outer membrane autotransporter protein
MSTKHKYFFIGIGVFIWGCLNSIHTAEDLQVFTLSSHAENKKRESNSFFSNAVYIEPGKDPIEVRTDKIKVQVDRLSEHQKTKPVISSPLKSLQSEIAISYKQSLAQGSTSCNPPSPYTAIPLVNWLNSVGIGTFLNDLNKKMLLDPQAFTTFNSMNRYGFSISPFVFHGHANPSEENQFQLTSSGVSLGGSLNCLKRYVLGIGAGFIHTGIDWKKEGAQGNLNGLFFTPYMGYISDRGFLSLTAVLNRSFYNLSRSFSYPSNNTSQKATLKNQHDTSSLGLKLEGAFDLLIRRLIFRPNFGVDYLFVLEDKYDEKEKGETVFEVQNSHSSFLRSKFALQIRKDVFKSKTGFISSSLNIGWVSMQPLSQKGYDVQAEVGSCSITMKKGYPSSGQLLLGAGVVGLHKSAFGFALDISTQLLGKYNVQSGKVTLSWDW